MKRLAITAILLAALGLSAAAASAAVSVYNNPFDSRTDLRQLKRMPGTSKGLCKKSWHNKEALGVQVLGGKRNCRLESPVLGDGPQPNHTVHAVAKVTKSTHKNVLKATYVGVTVRANRKGGYELRVFPKTRKWELIRSGVVLEKGKERKIKPARKKNRLRISADKGMISAKVNGASLASFRDQSAEEVDGRGTGVVFGVRKNAKRKKVATAFFDNVKVLLP